MRSESVLHECNCCSLPSTPGILIPHHHPYPISYDLDPFNIPWIAEYELELLRLRPTDPFILHRPTSFDSVPKNPAPVIAPTFLLRSYMIILSRINWYPPVITCQITGLGTAAMNAELKTCIVNAQTISMV